jgi:hypothetical protein
MKAQSPPQFHSLHGDTPESYDMEAAEYAAWLVSNKTFKTVKIWMVDRELQWLGFYCTFIPS